MALDKGYCTNCKNVDDSERVFDLSMNSNVCYCPHCLAKYNPVEANKTYRAVIRQRLKSARKSLIVESNFSKAYFGYAKLLSIDPDNITGRLGRLLTLGCLSTIRKSMFLEVKELLDCEAPIYYSNHSVGPAFYLFSKRMVFVIRYYLHKFKFKTSYRGYFFDADCLSLYFQRVRESLILLETLLIYMNKLLPKNVPGREHAIIKLCNEGVTKLKTILKSKFAVIDGNIYSLTHFLESGKALISKVDVIKNKKFFIGKSAVATLDMNAKHKIIIRDSIFTRYTNVRRMSVITFWTTVDSAVLFALFLTLFIIYFSSIGIYFLWPLLIFFITLVISFSLLIYYRKALKRNMTHLF